MIHNIERIGNFTSSEISDLCTWNRGKTKPGAPFYTYIGVKNNERRLGRSIKGEMQARPFSWGHLLEAMVFNKVGIEYKITSNETKTHPTIKNWAGSKDSIKYDEGVTIADFKNPITLDSFCTLVNPLYDGLTGIDAMNAIRFGYKDTKGVEHAPHKDAEWYFWQGVSNCCIDDAKYFELIVHMPYFSEIEVLKLLAQNAPEQKLSDYAWIVFAKDDELPYLLDGGFYKDVNIIRFEVPQKDKDFLKERVQLASKLLIKI